MQQERLAILATGAVLVGVLIVLYLLGAALLVFGISALIAYALLPVARLLERGMPWRESHPDLSRAMAIGITFLATLGAFAGLLAMVIPPTIEQGRRFFDEFPELFNSARTTVEGWIERYTDTVPPDIRDQVEDALAKAGGILGQAAPNLISKTWSTVAGSFGFILSLATAPMLIFYMMKDPRRVKSALTGPFPLALRAHMESIMEIADRTVGGYIRGQLTLGLIVGVIVTAGLLLLGIPFAFVLGLVAGLTELIPIIGPWIGGAAGVLVTLAIAPDKVLWVILLYLGVQIVENTLLVPRIQGDTLKLHPVAIILIITLSSQYFGLWGVILGPPLIAMGRDMVAYLIQEWKRPTSLAATEPDVPEQQVAEPSAGG